ncbi:cell division protein FtsK [Salinifilum aidingensis]
MTEPTATPSDEPQEPTPLATVTQLPTAESGSTDPAEGEVIEAEVITEEEYQQHKQRTEKDKALQRLQAYRHDAVVAKRTAAQVARHPKSKAAAAHVLCTAQGFGSWGKRAWDVSTHAAYRRALHAAEAAGNREEMAQWAERIEQAKKERHRRLMDAPRVLANLAKIGVGSLAAFVALVLLSGILVATTGLGSFTDPVYGVFTLIRWVLVAISVAWTPLLIAAPFVVILAAWAEGRKRTARPSWLATAAEPADVPIDESTIAEALKALRISQITDHLKHGLPLQYLTPARRDGRGTYAQVRLPAGVTADRVSRRRDDLATGLHRLSKEVFPTTGTEAGILDLWVADKGALEQGAGDYPLLEDGLVDVFKGVPFGRTLRGDPITAPLMERNTLVGGMPGQGKSSGGRVIVIGAALDPSAELRIWVPDANFDFEAFRPRCSRYVMGAEDEKIAEIKQHLEELHAEVQRRGQILINHGEPQVTRELADKGIGLHPLVCLLEEAHVAIQHPEHGKEIAQLLVDIVRLGRKRGIHLIVSTQAPTKDSMPRDVTRNCSNGIAYAVGDHVANDALLGQGAYAAGHRATELIPGTDKGTAVCKGFSGERSDLVQAYFLSVSKTNDQITPLIQRAMAAIAERGTVPGTGQQQEQPAVETHRDLLDDLDAVLGTDTLPIADVPALLRDHAPHWAPYQQLTGTQLRQQLAELGVKVPSTGRKYPLDPARVRAVRAERDAARTDTDESDDGEDE